MKKTFILIFLILFSFSFIEAKDVNYEIFVEYNGGEVEISLVKPVFFTEFRPTFGFWNAVIRDYQSNVLHITFFELPNKISVFLNDQVTNELLEEERVLEEFSFELILPYFENATLLEIYDDNFDKKASYDLTDFSKVNKILIEKYLNESFEEEGILEEVEEGEERELEGRPLIEIISDYWWILLLVLIILVIFLIFKIYKKGNKTNQHNT